MGSPQNSYFGGKGNSLSHRILFHKIENKTNNKIGPISWNIIPFLASCVCVN